MIENHNTAMLLENLLTRPPAVNHRCELPKKIGVMADSHGNITSIANCIKCLTDRQAAKIVHLGDVFDSEIHDHLISMVEIIKRHDIVAVKGNNDYQIEKMMANHNAIDLEASDRQAVRQFIDSMKLYLTAGELCFAHSLPYESIRSFYDPIDTGNTDQAVRIFHHTTHHVLFSGHSHLPVLFRWRAGTVTREPISVSVPLVFEQNERYIVIVGSSDHGECGFIDREKMAYERIRW
jgi:predicted phosphodiesterase